MGRKQLETTGRFARAATARITRRPVPCAYFDDKPSVVYGYEQNSVYGHTTPWHGVRLDKLPSGKSSNARQLRRRSAHHSCYAPLRRPYENWPKVARQQKLICTITDLFIPALFFKWPYLGNETRYLRSVSAKMTATYRASIHSFMKVTSPHFYPLFWRFS